MSIHDLLFKTIDDGILSFKDVEVAVNDYQTLLWMLFAVRPTDLAIWQEVLLKPYPPTSDETSLCLVIVHWLFSDLLSLCKKKQDGTDIRQFTEIFLKAYPKQSALLAFSVINCTLDSEIVHLNDGFFEIIETIALAVNSEISPKLLSAIIKKTDGNWHDSSQFNLEEIFAQINNIKIKDSEQKINIDNAMLFINRIGTLVKDPKVRRDLDNELLKE